ncbi:MAG: cell division protein FtsL [Anaeromyxobacteraceae bacterium]
MRKANGRSPFATLVRAALLVAVATAVALFHVWSHAQVTDAGYRLDRLRVRQKDLAAERARLELEVAALRAPGRLERYARAKLGMAPPAPGSVVAWCTGEAVAGRAGTVGGEDSHRAAPAEPKYAGEEVALRTTR